MNKYHTNDLIKNNNFDFLRLIFSSSVIVSHSFPLTGKEEFIAKITKADTLGGFAVSSFFVISGYLIFKSLLYSKTWQNYLWKRILRLYPALIILILITLCLLPFFYDGNQRNIFYEISYWTYFPNVLSLYKIQHSIEGIFELNVFPKEINGSLWTLPYEFTMYIGLLMLFPLKKSKNVFFALFFCFLCCYFIYLFRPGFLSKIISYIFLDSYQFYKLAAFFLAGSLLACVNIKYINKLFIRILIFFLLCTSIYIGIYQITSFILLPIFLILVGNLSTRHISNFGNKIGDLSYGIYIYGFLVQQSLMNFFNLNVIELTLYGLIITYIFAFISWNLIEKPFQKLKRII